MATRTLVYISLSHLRIFLLMRARVLVLSFYADISILFMKGGDNMRRRILNWCLSWITVGDVIWLIKKFMKKNDIRELKIVDIDTGKRVMSGKISCRLDKESMIRTLLFLRRSNNVIRFTK